MSNSLTWAETFAPIEAKYKADVYAMTWGHLAPEKNVTYRTQLLFSVSEYNSHGVSLVQDGLPNSPWMFDAICDWISNFRELPVGFYKVDVTFRNFKFWGKPIKINI